MPIQFPADPPDKDEHSHFKLLLSSFLPRTEASNKLLCQRTNSPATSSFAIVSNTVFLPAHTEDRKEWRGKRRKKKKKKRRKKKEVGEEEEEIKPNQIRSHSFRNLIHKDLMDQFSATTTAIASKDFVVASVVVTIVLSLERSSSKHLEFLFSTFKIDQSHLEKGFSGVLLTRISSLSRRFCRSLDEFEHPRAFSSASFDSSAVVRRAVEKSKG